MQKALPHRQRPLSTANGVAAINPPKENSSTKVVAKVVSENAVVVFARSCCCMCHVVKLLLHGHGVNPIILDVEEKNEAAVFGELSAGEGGSGGELKFPVVFLGGKLFGGLEEIMRSHISGELVPRLREAGALWL